MLLGALATTGSEDKTNTRFPGNRPFNKPERTLWGQVSILLALKSHAQGPEDLRPRGHSRDTPSTVNSTVGLSLARPFDHQHLPKPA